MKKRDFAFKTVRLRLASEAGSPCRIKTELADFSCTVPFERCEGVILLNIVAGSTAEITVTNLNRLPPTLQQAS